MKRIPPFRNRRDVFYLVHKEPTRDNENGIYIVKPKDNSYRAIWAVVWGIPMKLMSTSDGYTKEEVDKIISTIKDYQKENDKLLENIKLEISKLNSEKADRTELANVVAGLVPMGSVANLTELEAKPKRNNDAYYVEDQLSPEGNAYIYRWDAGLNRWVNTKQVVFKDIITQGLGDSSNKVMSQKATSAKFTELEKHLYNGYITLDSTKEGKIYIHAKAGHTYRIYPITKTWDLTEITDYYAFAWGYVNGETMIDIDGVKVQGFTALNDYYDVTLPDNAEMLMIRAVGVPNQKLYIAIEDISYANSLANSICSLTHNTKLRNGSAGNSGNPNIVTTEIMPLKDKASFIFFQSSRPLSSSNRKYYFGVCFTSSVSDIGSIGETHTLNGYISHIDPTTESGLIYAPIPENAVGVNISVGEYDPNNKVVYPLRVSDFPMSSIYFTTSKIYDPIFLDIFKRCNNTYDIATNNVNNSTRVVIDAQSDNTYRIYPLTKTWDFSDSTNYYAFAWGYVNGETMIDIDGVKVQGFTALNDYYDIKVPSGINNIAVKAIGKPGEHIYFYVENITELKSVDNICTRNHDKKPMLTASCRYRKSSNTSKDFQLLIVTDSHNDIVAVENAVEATNGFNMIDAMIHCGDVGDHIMLNQNVDYLWKNIAVKCEKPYYFVIGNHEAGTYYPISTSPSQEQLYNSFIKPSIDAGYLTNGEYKVGKCYYYHDFTSMNIRLIVINEYEVPRVPNTNSYWKPIAYNSNLPIYANTTDYTIGNQVNVSGYTDYSFEAVSDFNSGGYYDFRSPCVKYRQGYRWISQLQAQWFLDTLASTPSGYKIVVACHNPFSKKADVDQTKMFSQKNNWTDGNEMQNYMVNDFVADAINAFQNKQNFSTTCSSEYPDDMASYTVSKNFSSVTAIFHSLIGGHVHQDCVWKHQVFNQYQITPICTNSHSYTQCPKADIRRSNSAITNDIDTDCLTVVSFRPNQLGLVKLGVNVTEDGDKRDFEVIDISGN